MASPSSTNGNGAHAQGNGSGHSNGAGRTSATSAKNGLQTGYVMITVLPGYEMKVVEYLQHIPEIVEINPLFGDYDIVAKVEFSHYAVLNAIVLKKIRPLVGIRDTKTMLTTSFDIGGKKKEPHP